jgi:hypothetical protein
MVLPFFKAALDGGRLGTHNIYPDSDGVVRSYRMYHDVGGWKLPSLPLRVAESLGWKESDNLDLLLNWRGAPFTYRYASFADLYNDFSSKTRQRPQDEFKDKIVIIGSTAPSLFDVKPTSMARQFPAWRSSPLRSTICSATMPSACAQSHPGPGRSARDSLGHRMVFLPRHRAGAVSAHLRAVANRSARHLLCDDQSEQFLLQPHGPVTVGFHLFPRSRKSMRWPPRARWIACRRAELPGNRATVGTVAVFQIAGPDELSTGKVTRGVKKALDKMAAARATSRSCAASSAEFWGCCKARWW